MPGLQIKIILLANLVDDCAQQIHHLLLRNTDLFNFFTCSPMIAFFYKSKALSALARLQQHIVGACKLSIQEIVSASAAL